MTQWEVENGSTVRGRHNSPATERTIPFQPSAIDASQKRLCVSASTCVKRVWPLGKSGPAYKGMRRATEDKSGRKWEGRGGGLREGGGWGWGSVHERCVRRGTYCSRTHRSGRGSRALRHTDNWPGCRSDRSDIQTAQEHTCRQGPWWLQTFSTTLITHRQRRRFGLLSLIEDLSSHPPTAHQRPSRSTPTEKHRRNHPVIRVHFQRVHRRSTTLKFCLLNLTSAVKL